MGKQSRRKHHRNPDPGSCLVIVTRVGTPGLDGFDFTGYSLVQCDTCQHECWISPQSRDVARQTGSTVRAVCSVCGGGDNAIGNAKAVATSLGIPTLEFL